MDPTDSSAPSRAVLAPLSLSATNITAAPSTGLPLKPGSSSNSNAAVQQQQQTQYRVPIDLTGAAPQPRPPYNYAPVPTPQATGHTAHVTPTYPYQSAQYNPLPRGQPSAISVPQPISQPGQIYQSYPRYQYNSSFPVAASQYAAAHNLPPPVGRIKFSLISPKDFTILSSKYRYGDVSTDDDFMKGFQSDIKRLAKAAGGATFEQPSSDDDDEELLGTARWRVPLKAYDDVFAFFDGRDDLVVEGIPQEHLRAANLHLQHLEEGYPEPKALVEKGIPQHLASTLTGYQRGGVNFVLSKNGRALIADEMGLGKTLQSIASMCAYVDEGPLLVLCPSSVRFNWKAEIMQWLGKGKNETSDAQQHATYVTESNVQVFQSGKDTVKEDAKVVIASYDLFANMVKKAMIVESTFKRIIVDESHMLKNMKAQRTKAALPILKAAKRCILLSGTPAFKNPSELYPQLHILGGGKWWANEKDFKEKYCYKNSSVGGRNNLELFSLMSATVMIRRKKADVLKEVLPKKNRELAHVAVTDPTARKKLDKFMEQLRDTKGSLGVVARGIQSKSKNQSSDLHVSMSEEDVMKGLEADLKVLGLEDDKPQDIEEEKAFLPKLFELSGHVKVPVVVSQLKSWLNANDGKIIVFAHHHSVLDEIEASLKAVPTIRIDGKTNPKKRQENVVSFQKDPRVRVAVLSTTAAGVGITLTASATVWFAEMYWTPGLLIQAEDRSHRIGQKNDVNVLYYVARDTLDEVLWKLAVRKFIAVGEMVDGSTSTLGVNKKGEATLLNVELELGSSLEANKDEKKDINDFIVDDNKESAGWGCVADVLPSKDAEFTAHDEDSSAAADSFDSGCLTDDDEIEEEDSDTDDEVEIVELEDSDSDTEEEEF